MESQDHIGLDRLLEISRCPRAADPSEKKHLATCVECSEKLTEITLQLVAFQDNYIWDEDLLEPVPKPVMEKMRKAAKNWAEAHETKKERQVDSVKLKVSDEIIEFPRLRAVGAMGQSEDKTLRKAARSGDEEVPEYGETQLLSDNRGVVYTDTSSGHLCVQLIGPPEKTAGLRLALCEKKPDGSWRTCLEEKTNKLGIADFGRIDDIPRPQFEQVYTLLIEKTADSGSED